MATFQIGIDLAPTAAEAAGTNRSYTTNASNYNSLGSAIPPFFQIQKGSRVKLVSSRGRAETGGQLASVIHGFYETNSDGTQEGPRIPIQDLVVSSSVGTVAWYDSVAYDIDLTSWATKYAKGGIGYGSITSPNRWRKATVTGANGDMVFFSGNLPPIISGAANQATVYPFKFTIEDGREYIDSVNSGLGITAGASAIPITLSSFLTAPTSVKIGPLSLSGIAFNSGTQALTVNCPAYSDGAIWPTFDGVAQLSIIAGSQNAMLVDIPTNPPAGWGAVTISSPVIGTGRYLADFTDLSNHEVSYDRKIGQSALVPEDGLSIAPDSSIEIPSDLAGLHVMYKRNLTTGELTQLNVTLSDAGDVVSIERGLAAVGLSSKGISASGLVAVGL